LALLAIAAPAAWAQANPPHLAYLYPAGGQRGTTIEVKAGGQFLNNAAGVSITGRGVGVALGGYARPMTGVEAMQLRDKVQELMKTPGDAGAQAQLVEIRSKLATFQRNMVPSLAETETLEITVEPGAEAGRRELRLATPAGLSNPVAFYVGELPEYVEAQSDVRILLAGINLEGLGIGAEKRVTPPVTINGRITPRPARQQTQQFTPGEADRYRFEARKGQQLVVVVKAQELIPYLADAVPGWFQPTVAIFDAQGREVAYQDDYRFHPDPALRFEVPSDGEYAIEIKDALYRGREDFVYRVTVAEAPFITGIFPLGGRAGAETAVAVSGWNLPSNKLFKDARNKAPGVYSVSLFNGTMESNSVPFAVDTLPEMVEKEPNDSVKSAERVKLPVIVNGRIDRPGDWDVFRFEGRKGDEIVAEVFARRLDSPLDSVLKLTDASGAQLAFNDDHDDPGFALITHQADSLIMAALPADGAYYLHLGDTQHQGGPEYAYRLRISQPRPDFELRVTPSAINGGRGMSIPITVHALRKDGFAGGIALALKDAPRGVTLAGGTIPAGQDEVRATLTIAPAAQLGESLRLAMEGRATIGGREIVRRAVPADERMQAFAYKHLVPAEELLLTPARLGAFRTPARVLSQQPVRIPAGGEARVRVQAELPPNNLVGKLHFELSDPPPGIELRSAPNGGDGEIALACDGAKAKAGMKGNLIVNIWTERAAAANAAAQRPNAPQRVNLGTLPAVQFEVTQ